MLTKKFKKMKIDINKHSQIDLTDKWLQLIVQGRIISVSIRTPCLRNESDDCDMN